ncbi:hypothetical protein GLYMA_06G250751v4 [Glycine max]|nr:hypothetical protein GLYMA_06G250751v4 [Glycine max]KAH1127527.1 hypothetical protein GYH30_016217 [Glycine max]
MRMYLLIISLAFLGFRFEKKTVYSKIPKSNGGRRIWTTNSQFACISLCSDPPQQKTSQGNEKKKEDENITQGDPPQ